MAVGKGSKFRLELNSAGVQALLKDQGVAADLDRRGHAIAGAMPAGGWGVSSFIGRDRAQTIVRTTDKAARAAAAENPADVLGALGAGRG